MPAPTWYAMELSCTSESPLSTMVVVSTIETASFRIDSPNTNMFKIGSTSSACKVLKADRNLRISEPKENLKYSKGGHRVNSTNEWAERKALNKCKRVDNVSKAKQIDATTNHKSRYGRAEDGKHQDAPNVLLRKNVYHGWKTPKW